MKTLLTLLICLGIVGCGDASQAKVSGIHHPDTIRKVICERMEYVTLPDECK